MHLSKDERERRTEHFKKLSAAKLALLDYIERQSPSPV